ncbi:hypothetical protein GF342_01855 [Candidatus Woesearchaeota archaeon]|nr:hypothetical protein [Candidatus Woesearchaeota archaeon]
MKKRLLSKDAAHIVLAGDIGGTNTTLAIAAVQNKKVSLLRVQRFSSQNLSSLEHPIKEMLSSTSKKVHRACLAIAGPIHNNRVKVTNLPWVVNGSSLAKKTGLQSCTLINDFQAIGFGVDLLPKKDIVTLQKGVRQRHAPKAIVGAGTGLGKSIVVYDKEVQMYVPLPSEGGHGDLPFTSAEQELSSFLGVRVEQEMVLSGKGIARLFDFFRGSCYEDIARAKDPAPLVAHAYSKNRAARQAMDVFACFYARVLKNFCLDTLPFGGAYIAGGIAAKNTYLFIKKKWLNEFCAVRKELRGELEKIPVYLIKNYSVSLYGAALAARVMS